MGDIPELLHAQPERLAEFAQHIKIIAIDLDFQRRHHGRSLVDATDDDAGLRVVPINSALQSADEVIGRAGIGRQYQCLRPAGHRFAGAEHVVVERRCALANGPVHPPHQRLPAQVLVEPLDQGGGVVNGSPVGQLDLQVHLVPVGAREELCGERGEGQKAGDRQDQRQGHRAGRMLQRPVQCAHQQCTGRAAVNAHLPPMSAARQSPGQQPCSEHRGDDQCQQQRTRQHNHDGDGYRTHEVSCGPGQDDHRGESEHRGHRGGEQGNAQAGYGTGDGGERAVAVVDQTLADFIGHHNRAVDQQAQRNDQAGDGHLVDRDSRVIEHSDRKQCAQGQNACDHHGGTPAHGEQQYQQHQHNTERQITHHTAQALLGIYALVVADFDADTLRRQRPVTLKECAEVRGPAVDLQAIFHGNADQNALDAFDQHPGIRRGGLCAIHLRDIADSDRAALRRGPQQHVADLRGAVKRAVDFNEEIVTVPGAASGGDARVGAVQGGSDVRCAQACARQRHFIDGNANLLARLTEEIDPLGAIKIACGVGKIQCDTV